jgi:hypothetical protein
LLVNALQFNPSLFGRISKASGQPFSLSSNSVSVFISLARKLRGQHINSCSQVIHSRPNARQTAFCCGQKPAPPRPLPPSFVIRILPVIHLRPFIAKFFAWIAI